MKRTIRANQDMPQPKPVDKIILSEKKTGLRFVLLVLLILVAIVAFACGVVNMLGRETGWTDIEVSASAEVNCGNEFEFRYFLGADGVSATVEGKRITALYTDAIVKAYQLFQNDSEYGDIHNIYYLNRHPNQEIEVDEVLYKAFEVCAIYHNRNLYLAPVYERYEDIFFCSEDWETKDFDPRQNQELACEFEILAGIAQEEAQVQLRLLGDNKIYLYVSDAYMQYAQTEHIASFIDFNWMKNAFIIDYLAEVMLENGYTRGNISSYDGFSCNLDDSDNSYSYPLYVRENMTIFQTGMMQYSGRRNLVFLRDYAMNKLDFLHYYELKDGQIRTAYLDVKDGLSKASIHSLVSYSSESGCAELLMQMIPAYISDEFEREKLPEYSVYYEDGVIYYNDSDIIMTDLKENACIF